MKLLKPFAFVVLALGLAAVAQAQDSAVNPTGTWTWSSPSRNGASRTNTLTLKYDGSALSGSIKAPGRGGAINSADISDGKVTGDKITFNVVRESNGNSMTTGYEGTVTADTIKGKINSERNGEKRSRPWEAKRETSAP